MEIMNTLSPVNGIMTMDNIGDDCDSLKVVF